jgi:hypothetical protein
LTGVNPGQLGGNPALAMTIKSSGGLIGGFSNPVPPSVTSEAINFPVTPASSGFPYAGIS